MDQRADETGKEELHKEWLDAIGVKYICERYYWRMNDEKVKILLTYKIGGADFGSLDIFVGYSI